VGETGVGTKMPDGSERFCGVLVLGGEEYPCVLEQGHDGFCDFGTEAG
jgi:hypothetical protein